VQIRLATPDDAEAMERIRIRGWQAAYRHVFPREELDTMQVDAKRFERALVEPPPRTAAFVVEDTRRVVGWVVVGPSRDGEDLGEVHGIYVDPEHWSRGAGRTLLRRGEMELALSWGEAILWVLDDNPRARRFYEIAGWHADGARSQFERRGFSAPQVRYRKRLSSAPSRS
jgi:GNAT superfamily N-acetyltransferase